MKSRIVDNQRFSVGYSKYTGARSTRQNEIHSDGGFSISVDMLHMDRLKGQINDLQNSMVTSDEQIKEYDNQVEQSSKFKKYIILVCQILDQSHQ